MIKLEITEKAVYIECNSLLMRMELQDGQELRQALNLQYRALRPNKNWTKCPYEAHANDCDCGGVGGDR